MRIHGVIKYLRNCAETGTTPQVSATDARLLVKRYDAMAGALALKPEPEVVEFLANACVLELDRMPSTMGYRDACKQVLGQIVREYFSTFREEAA